MPSQPSIRVQLLMLVLAVVLPAAGLVTHLLQQGLNEARRGAERQLQELVRDTAGRIDGMLQRRARLMARLAERPLVRALDGEHCDPALAEMMALQADWLTLALRRQDGALLCAAQPGTLPADTARTLPWFRDGLASGHFEVSAAYEQPRDGGWVTMLTQPVRNAAGEVGGLLTLAVDLPALQQQLLPALPQDAIVVAFDRQLHHLMHTAEPARWIGQPLPASQHAQLPARSGEAFELTGVDGVRRLQVAAAVPAVGWQVLAALPVAPIAAGYRTLLTRSLVVGAVVVALAGLLAWRVGRRIARPAGQREPPPSRQAHSASHAQRVAAARDIVLLIDPQGRIVEANSAALAAYGYSVEELRGMSVSDLRTPEARAMIERDFRAAARPDGVLFETVHRRKDGSELPVEVSSCVVEVDGQPLRQSFIRDISARKRDEALLHGQNAVLAQMAQGAPLAETLDALARLVEALAPGMVATILLLDDDGVHLRHGAAPSLPPAFVEAIDGASIGPQAGACGTAAHRRAPVLSEDIATDPLWEDWRALALAQGLRACWSTPIVDTAGQVLGTFAMYFRRPGPPDAAHRQLVELVTHTAAMAIIGARSARTQRAQLDELLRWQALMVDREDRMRTLQAEVDALRVRLGVPPRYTEGGQP